MFIKLVCLLLPVLRAAEIFYRKFPQNYALVADPVLFGFSRFDYFLFFTRFSLSFLNKYFSSAEKNSAPFDCDGCIK